MGELVDVAVTDFSRFAELRRDSTTNKDDAIEAVAGQFEALFIESVLKSMKDAKLAEPMLGGSSQSELYEEFLHKQLASNMTEQDGIGLKALLIEQLGGKAPKPEIIRSEPMHTAREPVSGQTWSNPSDFVRDIWPHARQAADELNVSAKGLVAQAALETGWGKHVARRADGVSSFNLFGIKATSSWDGGTTAKKTIEFRDGLPQPETARFRVYSDIAANFDDYVDVVGTQPRFDKVRENGADIDGFADALQESGYATDPAYSQKLRAVFHSDTMERALGSLRLQNQSPGTFATADVR